MATLRNVDAFSDGRGGAQRNTVIPNRHGRWQVTVNIDGCHTENPNGTPVTLREDAATLRDTIPNAHVELRSLVGFQKGTDLLIGCVKTVTQTCRDCLAPKEHGVSNEH